MTNSRRFLHFQYHQHIFVNIGGKPISYTDPPLEVSFCFHWIVSLIVFYLEHEPRQEFIYNTNLLFQTVEIKQIFDKFPKTLKDLYEKGPQNAFYLVKCWADLNTDISGETGVFYGADSQYVSHQITQ